MSKLRSQIISDNFLAKIALSIDLGELIFMSHGERKSGASKRVSMLADCMEAVLGACYLDQGLSVTKDVFFVCGIG